MAHPVAMRSSKPKGTLLCLAAALLAILGGSLPRWIRLERHGGYSTRTSPICAEFVAPHTHALPARTLTALLPLCGVLCALVLLMLAPPQMDDTGPVSDVLSLADCCPA
ncbi:hypothetical protein MJ588_11845 [Klebsiella pneumoniae]|nr:hypothetical protein MJ588_11845 [Klebsiella pneumoniae]